MTMISKQICLAVQNQFPDEITDDQGTGSVFSDLPLPTPEVIDSESELQNILFPKRKCT